MATYKRFEVTTRRVEFHVPTHEPWGACWVEVQKAMTAAISEMRDAGLLGPDEQPHDELIRLHAADEAIIVAYEMAPTSSPESTVGGGVASHITVVPSR